MPGSLVIFEDARFRNFQPLTFLRPVCFLRAGVRPLYKKIIDEFDGYSPYIFCRPEIERLTSEQTDIPVNTMSDRHTDEVILINGALRFKSDLAEALKKADTSVIISTPDDDIAAMKIVGQLSDESYQFLMNGDLQGFIDKFEPDAETMKIDLPFYNYLWDFMAVIDDEIKDDFDFFQKTDVKNYSVINIDEFPGANFIDSDKILIAADVEILPGSVIDASHGPIVLDRGARIEPPTYLIGPAYVGPESILVGGRIEGSSIGPVCRVGGELEESIIQGYSNKYHAGFIGHSYVGEWVNFGAMTTNSDLKNNYRSVSVSVNGEMIDTGMLKVGSFIGDFTKTAIGTLFNTGINIGLSCNILGDGLVTDKEIKSFTWYSPRHKMTYNVVKAIETIERTMIRRKINTSEALADRLRQIYSSSWKSES